MHDALGRFIKHRLSVAWTCSVAASLGVSSLVAADPMPFHQMGEAAPLSVPKGMIPDTATWAHWGNTAGNLRFSNANQIDVRNVSQLKAIWKYSPGPDATAGVWQATPLVVNGVMYLTDPYDGAVALDPETGKVLWTFRVPDRKLRVRGISYWPGDATHGPRIIFGHYDRVYALDPATGRPIADFGDGHGYIDLRKGITEDWPDNEWQITSPPAIFENLLIVGGATSRVQFTSQGASVDPRAYDIRTGKQIWRFNLVPRPGQRNFGTWAGDSWKNRTGPSAWAIMAVDPALGLVYVPVGTANAVMLGMDRPGDNLYANSILALDARTGRYRWHFQTTRHDIWDYDLPSPPALMDIVVRGKKIPAIVQVGKTGLMFILDRRNGKPVFGVEYRPVPRSEIPGEIAAETQPFPIKPLPLVPLGFRRADMTQVTPESNRACNARWDREGLRDSEIYQPTRLHGGTVVAPSNNSAAGGTYGGASINPYLGYIYIHTRRAIGYHAVEEDGKGGIRIKGPYRGLTDDQGLPCANPPWSELIAINASTGDVAWRRPLGIVEALGERGLSVGNPGNGGSVATAGGLIFIGATSDARFRAFDGFTGKELWVHNLPAHATGSPITYIGKSGRQYVVIAGGRSREENSLIAFAIPRPGERTIDIAPRSAGKAAQAKVEAAPVASAPLPRTVEQLAPLPGKAAFVEMCTACHDVTTSLMRRRTARDWRDTVNDMRGRGAPGDDAKAARVVDYLTQAYGNP